ncbi:MAG TPA: TadE/TadG family type IV pilus assembly protein [Pseudolabrys sp.]|nr:TadE/TadG family type IV pilus assembly protein [Pseudolabrys sp.]
MNLRRVLGRFGGDRRGVSAVEFALLAPLMITLYVGCAEISDGVAADRKVSLTAAALANLAAQVTTISSTDMTNILDASSAIIAPYSTSQLSITLSCINIDANRNATVKWSVTRGGTARSGSITVPSALAVASTQLLLGEATYQYRPTVGYTVTGTLNLSDRMYMSPRITAPTYNSTSCSS